MEGIDPSIMSHHLNIDPSRKPVRQKRRGMDAERYKAFKEDVDKLPSNGFIKESFYPSWLTNPVLVKKPNGKWRTCGQLPITKDRPAGRRDLRTSIAELHVRLFGV